MNNWYGRLVPLICVLVFKPFISVYAQDKVPVDLRDKELLSRRKDIFDVFSSLIKKEAPLDSLALTTLKAKDSCKNTVINLLPSLNYTLVTRWAFGGILSGYYYLDKKNHTNMSSTDLLAIYTTQRQIILKLKSTIWPKANRYNFVSDWRFMKYPSYTYGLGPDAELEHKTLIDYNYLRIYQNVYKEIAGPFYVGLGYRFDYHYDIKEFSEDFISGFDLYTEGNQSRNIASGPTINLLFDSRENIMNPLGDRSYGFLSYRYNSTVFGSDKDWQSLIVDARKYIKLPHRGSNILALWSYNWFTFGGKPGYLNLPSTGWDAGDMQGRGYIQGRFRSNHLLSFESEYRFNITRNRVLGGVLFGNVQSVSVLNTYRFGRVFPAAGFGLRIKLNKYTNTNLSMDFATGIDGAKSVYFNIGEIF